MGPANGMSNCKALSSDILPMPKEHVDTDFPREVWGRKRAWEPLLIPG